MPACHGATPSGRGLGGGEGQVGRLILWARGGQVEGGPLPSLLYVLLGTRPLLLSLFISTLTDRHGLRRNSLVEHRRIH